MATFKPAETNMQQLVGAMTGAVRGVRGHHNDNRCGDGFVARCRRRRAWRERTAEAEPSAGLQILVLLVVLLVGFSLLEPTAFASVSNLRAIVVNTAILAVLGVGMTFVIITGGIDLSIGSVLVFSGVVASKVMTAAGGQGWGVAILGILVAVGCGTAWGVVNGVVIAKWNIPPLIVTLGTLGMSLGFAQIITGGVDIREVPEVLVDTIGYGQIGGEIPLLVVVSAILVVAGMVLLHRTRFGLYTYAVGSNAEGSRRVGVKVNRQLIKLYALSGCTAGIAGVLSLAYFQATTIRWTNDNEPQCHRRCRHRRHQLVRRHRFCVRNCDRVVRACGAAERLRRHGDPTILATGRCRCGPRRWLLESISTAELPW